MYFWQKCSWDIWIYIDRQGEIDQAVNVYLIQHAWEETHNLYFSWLMNFIKANLGKINILNLNITKFYFYLDII